MSVTVTPFFHEQTGTASYIVVDITKRHAVIIDSVLDFEIGSGKISTQFAQKQLDFLKRHDFNLVCVLDTHAHADHLSAANFLKSQTGAYTVIGQGILNVQARFADKLNNHQVADGKFAGFDRLVSEGDIIEFGSSEVHFLHTPGHTDDSMSFVIENNVFVGDTLFMPDGGTARCDFPGGDAGLLWQSIEKIHALPDDTHIWVCHDYQPNGREVDVCTTVGKSKANNIHVGQQSNEQDFIELRNKRDATLAAPTLLYPSLQVNLWGGSLPKQENNGMKYIKIPLTVESKSWRDE
ncbi:MBL fold metallo-hydrolase [Aliiglaciecola lipolytica]|uniref:Beta-lactamase hydrolase-like protein n=1 Tax=Aliiglaciecola lipolytica E3 TaxID=1127673 RepID=K6XQ85_9ALTE|nr:MBL fold metallo-hydrolase [Aliiglaciecola lipolytica]GAC13821.1 beta-lactamase hydrolase-like protein [Aliiglaciecola lipolytica E3]